MQPSDTDTHTTPSPMIPWIIAIAFFMQMLDGTILNTALPAMARSLHESPLRMQSTVIAYMLTVAMLIPASGWLADRFGSRRIFQTAILLFSLGSLLCALSPTLEWLTASRVVQGIGGALMLPVGRLIILRSYPRADLVRVLGFVTIPGLTGPLLGPILGGWIVEVLTWHWIFLINLPIGLAGFLVAGRFLPAGDDVTALPFDWKGFVLFSLAMVTLSFSLQGLGELQLAHAQVLLLLLLGLASLAAYWLHASRTDEPIFSLTLFRIHTFSLGILGNMFARLGSGAMPFLTPLFFQTALGYSPFKAGLTMAPLALAAMSAKPAATFLLKRYSYRQVLTINTFLLGIMIAGFALISNQVPEWIIYVYLAIFGAVNSIQFTAMNTLTLIDLGGNLASSGNSLLSVVMQLAMSLGIAASAALLNGFVGQHAYQQLLPAQILLAFHATYVCIGIMSIIAVMIFLQLHPHAGQKTNSDTVEEH